MGLAGSEEIPRAIGLSLVALCLLAVAGTSAWHLAIGRDNLRRERIGHAQERLSALSRHLGTLLGTDRHAAAAELCRYAGEPGVVACFVTDPADRYLLHPDARRVGKPWRPAPSIPLRHPEQPEWWQRADAQAGHLIEYVLPVRDPRGKLLGYLRSTYNPQVGAFNLTEFGLASACVLLATMGMLLLVYRRLRRAIRPMAAVRDCLLAYEAGIERELSALQISDSFGRISAAWNSLLGFLRDMEREIQQYRSSLSAAHAIENYRSKRFQRILNAMPYGVVQLAEDGRVAYANPAAAALLHVPEDKLLGARPEELSEDPVVKRLFSALGSASGTSEITVDRQIAGGQSSTTIRLTIAHGMPAGERTIFLQDVSQLKQAEKAREEFINHVAHELRTPLTSIRAYAETLANGMFSDEQMRQECYNVIITETNRLARMIEDVLNISQLEVGTAQLNVGQVYTDRLLREAIQDVQAAADEKGISLNLKLPPKMPVLTGDKQRLQIVLNNLLGNAIKYTPSGGRVEVVASVEPDRLLITVSDTGIGIAPENHERIFEKFHREDDPEVRNQPGTGLGLATARQTVRAHGGDITVESRKGQGATFVVQLPIEPAPAAEPTPQPAQRE